MQITSFKELLLLVAGVVVIAELLIITTIKPCLTEGLKSNLPDDGDYSNHLIESSKEKQVGKRRLWRWLYSSILLLFMVVSLTQY